MFNTFTKTSLASTITSSTLAIATVIGTAVSPASAQTAVDLELSLLVDASSSIDASEYQLQLEGYSQAFQNLANLDFEPFATNFVVWSDADQQQELIEWTLINDSQDALNFSNQLLGLGRPFSNSTEPGSAIFAAREGTSSVTGIFQNEFEGNRLVFDVSGDGIEDFEGLNTAAERNLSQEAGITINGLAIGDNPSVEAFYQNSVVTSDGFLVLANDFQDFQDAVTNKIQQEVINPEPIPEPTSVLALLTISGLGLVIKRRKQA
jgi:hypothetical protein